MTQRRCHWKAFGVDIKTQLNSKTVNLGYKSHVSIQISLLVNSIKHYEMPNLKFFQRIE